MNAKDQATEKVIEWAKFACEEMEARYSDDLEEFRPSWVNELRAAVDALEAAE